MMNRPQPQPADSATLHGTAAERAAWLFYGIAALGSSIGQIWVGVSVPPWPQALPWWAKALFVLPFAVVIDLGGVVTAAFADWRQRLGETAYGWRVLSAASVTVGVAINILGHLDVPYLAVVFGGLGVFAYAVWLLHSGARRRDALRAAGKLDDTAPVYGWRQWWREPDVTRRARTLALQHSYSLHESLHVAREQLRVEARRAALASHIETFIRARHDNPNLAAIAVTTVPTDDLAAQLSELADVAGWARSINADLLPPVSDVEPDADANADDEADLERDAVPDAETAALPSPPADVLRRVPTKQADYDRWRELWAQASEHPELTNQAFADRYGVSVRTAQWIRAVGPTRLLDSPIPPVVRLMQLVAASNGHTPPPDSEPDGSAATR